MRKLLLIALLCFFAGRAVLAQDTTVSIFTTVIRPTLLATRPPVTATRPTVTATRMTIHPAAQVAKIPAAKTPVAKTPVTLRIYNPAPINALVNISLDWELQINGMTRRKGSNGPLTIAPQHEVLVVLQLPLPDSAADETFLQITYRSQARGIILAQEQLLLKPPMASLPDIALAGVAPAGELSFTDSNDLFTIRSRDIHLEFNKQTGWLQQYEANGAALLEDTSGLKSNFSGQGERPHLQLFSTSTGSELVIVRTEYTLPATSSLLHLSYTINALGEMLVSQQLETDSTQKGPPLPCFGMQWMLPAGYDSITYYGKGATPASPIAIYHEKILSPSPDIHLRGTGAGAVRWWKITGPGGSGLLITADSVLLNLSAIPAGPHLQLDIESGESRGQHDLLPYANYRYAWRVRPVSAKRI